MGYYGKVKEPEPYAIFKSHIKEKFYPLLDHLNQVKVH